MDIEVKKSPYTSKLGGDIDIIFSIEGMVVNTITNISKRYARKLKRKIMRYLDEEDQDKNRKK